MDFNTILFRRGHAKTSSKDLGKDDSSDDNTITDQDDDNPADDSIDTSDPHQDVSTLPSYLKTSSSNNYFGVVQGDEAEKKPSKMFDWNYLKSKAKRLELLNKAIRKEEENYSEYKYDSQSAGVITDGEYQDIFCLFIPSHNY